MPYDTARDQYLPEPALGSYYDIDLDRHVAPPIAGPTYDNRFDVYGPLPAFGAFYLQHHDAYGDLVADPSVIYSGHVDGYAVAEVDDVPPTDTFVPLLFNGNFVLFNGRMIGYTP